MNCPMTGETRSGGLRRVVVSGSATFPAILVSDLLGMVPKGRWHAPHAAPRSGPDKVFIH